MYQKVTLNIILQPKKKFEKNRSRKVKKSDFFGFWTPEMGSKRVNLGSKISNSRSVDFFRFFRIFSDFFEFFFEKVVFFQAFRPNFRPDGPILETRKPQNKIFQTQKRGYAKFKENRQSRFGWAQNYLFLYKTQIIPLQKQIHTQTGKVDTTFLSTPRFACVTLIFTFYNQNQHSARFSLHNPVFELEN